MQPSRVLGAAAVRASSVPAGIIESSSGSASDTPAPFRNVRRGRCFFEMNMDAAPLIDHLSEMECVTRSLRPGAPLHPFLLHPEWLAFHDADHERRKAIIVLRGA